MTKETQTVWRNKKGYDLIISRGNGKFRVPVAEIELEDIEELREALTDILNEAASKAIAEVVTAKPKPITYAEAQPA